MKIHLCSILIFMLALLSYTNGEAQSWPVHTEKNELSIGFGNWSPVQLLEGVHAGEDGYSEYPVDKTTGIFSLVYKRFLNNKIFFGIGIAYENESGDWNTLQSWTNVVTMGAYKRNVYSIAPEIGINYSTSRNIPVTTYGYIACGGNYLNEVDVYSNDYYERQYNNGYNPLGKNLQVANNRSSWAVQFCPIGVNFGGKLMGFGELGFGYKGILNFGVRTRL